MEYKTKHTPEVLQGKALGEKRIEFLPYKRIIRKTRELQKISLFLLSLYQSRYLYALYQKYPSNYVMADNSDVQNADIFPHLQTCQLYHLDACLKPKKTKHQVSLRYWNATPELTEISEGEIFDSPALSIPCSF
jgi:hypothetical protein